ncbi:AhpD family alkylhydroperoxidase [Chitinophaga sp. W3I9]|uniref:carboxymuconolactone decarboxylase family protein n=1 Tax=Chitinophaga sp. W3I9 TaxID=3373924 RepID=UPI003D198B62
MDYIKISKEAVGYLYKFHETLRQSEIDVKLIALAELRVSQINGCAYCCSFHANELREFGYDQRLLDKLPGWKLSSSFDARQKSVLQWAEAITQLHGDLTGYQRDLENHFSTKEIVDLTTSISLMNALNRLRISLGDH